jgi:6-phosphogluconolactonase (cycloisomerase 2 family)
MLALVQCFFSFSRLRACLLLSLGLVIAGCGSSADQSVAVGGEPGGPSPNGTIMVNQLLLRAVPSAVNQQRFTGFDGQGSARFGPVTLPKAATIELTGVGTSVTRLQIEYLQGNTVVGLGSVAVTVRANQTVTITNPPFQDLTTALSSLQVTPAASAIANGSRQQFAAVGTFADGTQSDLTSSVTWSSSNEGVATISGSGLAASVAPGSSTIKASFGPISNQTTLTVSSATIAWIAVTPATPAVADGTTQQFTAIATLSDGTAQNVTTTARWTSATTATATINGTGLAVSVDPGQTVITAAVGAVSGTATLTVTNAGVTELRVTPADSAIANGTTLQYTATATFSDGSTQDVSSSATWTSTTEATALVAPGGLATAVDPGITNIRASFGGQSSQTELIVNAATVASVAVTPATPVIADGTTQQFTATARLSDGTLQDVTATASWTSLSTATATINGAGLATAVNPGQTLVTATAGGIAGTATLTVTEATIASIAINPPAALSAPGSRRGYNAIATFSDRSTQDVTSLVTWSSDDTEVTFADNNIGPNRIGQAIVDSDATAPQTVIIRANLGALNATSTLTLGSFVYVANQQSATLSVFTVDHTTGALTAGTAVETGSGPRSVTVDPSGRFAYVANFDSDTVSVFTITPSTGALTAGTAVATGSGPSSVTVHPSGRFAYVTNFSNNTMSMFTINPTTGALTAGTDIATGSGPSSVAVDPSGRFAYVTNFSSDTVSMFTITPNTGVLTGGTAVATGRGPSSVAVDPSGRFAYTADQFSNRVSAFTINPRTGTLSAGTAELASEGPVSIAVDPTGRFAYSANGAFGFGGGSVGPFAIAANGDLIRSAQVFFSGDNPRSVAVDPSGRFVYVANFLDNSVSVFPIEPRSGSLTAGISVAAGTNPTSVATTP